MELFSYHLIEAPLWGVAVRLVSSSALARVPGLRHGECLLPMRMGHGVMLPAGYYTWTHYGHKGTQPAFVRIR